MTMDPENVQAALWRAFRRKKPPERITQEAFDFDTRHLLRLARLTPGESAEADDLWSYTQDLRYTEIQVPLLEYVLPFCLAAWCDDLLGTHSNYGGYVEQLYPALADKVLRLLNSSQTAAIAEFMRQAILEEIDSQRGLIYQGMGARPYRWIAALTSYGVLLEDVARLWAEWWSVGTVGRAIAVAQYVSCLMYEDNENPIFAPWTRGGGGGPPCLWEFAGNMYNHRWLHLNVSFLERSLNVEDVSSVLKRAVEKLANEPELVVASQLLADLPLCIETIEARCAELPRLLETNDQLSRPLSWSK